MRSTPRSCAGPPPWCRSRRHGARDTAMPEYCLLPASRAGRIPRTRVYKRPPTPARRDEVPPRWRCARRLSRGDPCATDRLCCRRREPAPSPARRSEECMSDSAKLNFCDSFLLFRLCHAALPPAQATAGLVALDGRVELARQEPGQPQEHGEHREACPRCGAAHRFLGQMAETVAGRDDDQRPDPRRHEIEA